MLAARRVEPRAYTRPFRDWIVLEGAFFVYTGTHMYYPRSKNARGVLPQSTEKMFVCQMLYVFCIRQDTDGIISKNPVLYSGFLCKIYIVSNMHFYNRILKI